MQGTSFWMIMAAVGLVIWLIIRNYVGGIADIVEGAALQGALLIIQT